MPTFNMKDYKLTVGAQPITGLGDGDMVIVARANDAAGINEGGTGDSCFYLTNSTQGTITIRTLRSSADNIYLSGLMLEQELAGGGEVAITIEDVNGGDVHQAPACRLQKPPDGNYSNDMAGLDYVFLCLDVSMFYGGN